jgi:hypothetical protein
MTNQEIIQKLKENTSAFDLVDKELKEFAQNQLSPSDFEVYKQGSWQSIKKTSIILDGSLSHRLKADYNPEPEYERFEIYSQCNALVYDDVDSITLSAFQCEISKACQWTNFSHFEKDKGNKIDIENIATYIHSGGKVFVVLRKG